MSMTAGIPREALASAPRVWVGLDTGFGRRVIDPSWLSRWHSGDQEFRDMVTASAPKPDGVVDTRDEEAEARRAMMRASIDRIARESGAEIAKLKSEVARLVAENKVMRELIEDLEGAAIGSRVTAAGIIAEISHFHDIPIKLIKGPRRSAKILIARHHAMYEVVRRCDWMSYPEVGGHFGNRDHTTILHAVREWPAKAAKLGIECLPIESDTKAAWLREKDAA